MPSTASRAATKHVALREAEAADLEACAQICFDAFASIHDQHRFTRDFPAPETAAAMLGPWISHPAVWGVVAEVDGRIVGSNFLDERDPIRGVGPITVAPDGQNAGVGRRLMAAVLERGEGARGIRLVQDGFHMRSLALYTSLGFDVTASCAVMNGRPHGGPVPDVEVRPLREDDLEECAALCRRVHGFERTGVLQDAVRAFAPLAALRDGHIVAHATSLTFWPMAYGVAEGEADMQALLLGATASVAEPLALLVPLRSGLFRWCLDRGMRAVKPMNVMARGEYQEPVGSWFPSVLY